eukprot:s2815_g9.t1
MVEAEPVSASARAAVAIPPTVAGVGSGGPAGPLDPTATLPRKAGLRSTGALTGVGGGGPLGRTPASAELPELGGEGGDEDDDGGGAALALAREGGDEDDDGAALALARPLAMMAIVGLWVQNGLFGTPYGLYTGSSAFENELGVQAPAGFWDPLGFTKGGDAASFRRRRYVELKHGRVAMLACLGYIVPEYYRWPGDLSPSLGLKFTDVPTGFAAFSKVPLSGWAQMVAFAGSVELFQYVDDPKRAPGDFENAGYLGIPNGFVKSPEGNKEKKLSAEIANGRLAMMAIIGMFFQNGLTGTAWGDWSVYTDSPLRALSAAQELIVGTGGPFQDSFWDPAGITARSTEKEVLQLRAIELKHGRVAMLAVLHWFHVSAGYHLLGDYAIGEKMSNNPLVNMTQLPMGGMWQVVFTIMCLEWVTTYICKPPADRPWDVLGWKGIIDENYDSKIWNRWQDVQCQELNNGRLAMIAITGLVAQDVVTGEYFEGIGQLCFGAQVCKAPVATRAFTRAVLVRRHWVYENLNLMVNDVRCDANQLRGMGSAPDCLRRGFQVLLVYWSIIQRVRCLARLICTE